MLFRQYLLLSFQLLQCFFYIRIVLDSWIMRNSLCLQHGSDGFFVGLFQSNLKRKATDTKFVVLAIRLTPFAIYSIYYIYELHCKINSFGLYFIDILYSSNFSGKINKYKRKKESAFACFWVMQIFCGGEKRRNGCDSCSETKNEGIFETRSEYQYSVRAKNENQYKAC